MRSAFGLSNNNKWRWWMWMVAAIYRRTHSPSRLAWSEGWRPPGAQSAFKRLTAMVTMTAPINIITVTIIIPTYVDAVHCYRPSSVVCRSVCLSVTLVSPAKTAEPIELPFGLRTRVGPGNHVLDGGHSTPHGKGQF